MDVTQLPFNQLIGLTPADEASGFLVGISDDPNYTNHLGSVHASALLALAEAGSGEFWNSIENTKAETMRNHGIRFKSPFKR